METIVVVVLILISLLAGCQLYSRLKGHKGISMVILTVLVFVLDYLVVKYSSGKNEPGILKFMWVRIALISMVPLIMVGGCSMHSCLATALIGTGIIVMVMGLHDKEKSVS